MQLVCSIFLNIFNTYGVVFIALFGFMFIDRKKFKYCIYLAMLTMLYNTFLKNVFQIPLPLTCPIKGFGFPSGHMNFYSIVYLWIIFHYRNTAMRILCYFMIIFSGYSMVYLGFHYTEDVIAGFCFALISVILFTTLIEKEKNEILLKIYILICMCILCIALFLQIGRVEPHVYIASYFIIGFLYSDMMWMNQNVKLTFRQKIISVLLLVILIYFINLAFTIINFQYMPLKSIKWFLISLSIPCTVAFSSKIAINEKV